VTENTCIETVLNSRCSCDFDGDPKNDHWGLFVEDRAPSRKIKEHVLRCCRRTPQFSDGKLALWFEDKYLFLGFEETADPFKNRLLHIESGMQHEAVYLACTALGFGTCIHNLGVNGTKYGNKMATARHLILENVESYKEGKHTAATPGPEKPFKNGKNLPPPRRNGDTECLHALERLNLSHDHGDAADITDISQMLWAAKGRTPHYIKSHPWGLTIPTWGGGQDYTTVYLVHENRLYRYVNWTTSRYTEWISGLVPRARRYWWKVGQPTHDVKFARNVNLSLKSGCIKDGIIIGRNEQTNRALWEIGYILENLFLQAESLRISYKSMIFTRDEIRELEKNGIFGAEAAVLL